MDGSGHKPPSVPALALPHRDYSSSGAVTAALGGSSSSTESGGAGGGRQLFASSVREGSTDVGGHAAHPKRQSAERADGEEVPGERLYFEGREKHLAKQQRMIAMRLDKISRDERREEAACTFRPMLSPYAKAMHRPRSLSPENRALGEVLTKKEYLANRRRQLQMEELKGCTFRPITLRVATLSPELNDSPREKLHEELHAEHRHRQRYQAEVLPKAAQLLEDEVMYPKTIPKVSQAECENIVERLLQANEPEDTLIIEEADVNAHRPTVFPQSRRLAEKRRQECREPDDVVERLLSRPRAAETVADVDHEELLRHENTYMYHPEAANVAVRDIRAVHLGLLFRALSTTAPPPPPGRGARGTTGTTSTATAPPAPPGRGARGTTTSTATAPPAPKSSSGTAPILKLAEAATRQLPASDAADMIAMLGRTGKKALSEAEFIALAEEDVRVSGPKPFMYPRRQRTTKYEEDRNLIFQPRLSAKTHEMMPSRGKQAVNPTGVPSAALMRPYRAPSVDWRAEKEREEMAECTFAPTTTPYSGPIPPPPGWKAPESRSASARGISSAAEAETLQASSAGSEEQPAAANDDTQQRQTQQAQGGAGAGGERRPRRRLPTNARQAATARSYGAMLMQQQQQ